MIALNKFTDDSGDMFVFPKSFRFRGPIEASFYEGFKFRKRLNQHGVICDELRILVSADRVIDVWLSFSEILRDQTVQMEVLPDPDEMDIRRRAWQPLKSGCLSGVLRPIDSDILAAGYLSLSYGTSKRGIVELCRDKTLSIVWQKQSLVDELLEHLERHGFVEHDELEPPEVFDHEFLGLDVSGKLATQLGSAFDRLVKKRH